MFLFHILNNGPQLYISNNHKIYFRKTRKMNEHSETSISLEQWIIIMIKKFKGKISFN